MLTYLLTLAGFSTAMALMALGIMTRKKAPIRGCGESCRCFEREAASSPTIEPEV
jgi:hypothetical protein